MLMVLEDAHRIDPTTRKFFDLIIDRVPSLRMLLIITYRPKFTAPWADRSHVTLLNLNRLPPRERADMIRGVIRGKVLPKEFADQIIDRTDGIPLFIDNLTPFEITGFLGSMYGARACCRSFAEVCRLLR